MGLDDGQVPVEAAVKGDGQPVALPPDEDVVAAGPAGDGVGDPLDPLDERPFFGRDVPAAADARPPRFDVGVDALDGRDVGPEVLFDVAGQVVGLVEEEVVVDLEVEVDVDLAAVLVDADVVDRDLVPLGDRPDAPGHRLALALARVGVDDDIGARDEGLDAGLDVLGDGVGPFEGQVAVDLDGHVDEGRGPRLAEADLAGADDALDLVRRGRDLLLQPLRGAVEEDVDRALAQPVADEEHDEGDAQGGHRVGPVEEAGVAGQDFPADQNEGQADEDDGRAPDVGREVEGVGLEGLAPVLFRRPVEHLRAADVDHDRDDDDEKGPEAGIDMDVAEEDPADGLVDDPGAGDEEEQRSR